MAASDSADSAVTVTVKGRMPSVLVTHLVTIR